MLSDKKSQKACFHQLRHESKYSADSANCRIKPTVWWTYPVRAIQLILFQPSMILFDTREYLGDILLTLFQSSTVLWETREYLGDILLTLFQSSMMLWDIQEDLGDIFFDSFSVNDDTLRYSVDTFRFIDGAFSSNFEWKWRNQTNFFVFSR